MNSIVWNTENSSPRIDLPVAWMKEFLQNAYDAVFFFDTQAMQMECRYTSIPEFNNISGYRIHLSDVYSFLSRQGINLENRNRIGLFFRNRFYQDTENATADKLEFSLILKEMNGASLSHGCIRWKPTDLCFAAAI